MTSLSEIHEMLATSGVMDWDRISGWGIGAAPVAPALTSVENVDDKGRVEGWHSRNYSDLLVFAPDVDLSIAYGLPAHYEGYERTTFDWAEAHGWKVETRFADVRWRGQLVDRVTMWSTWKGVQVPVGNTDPEDGSGARYVERWQLAIAAAISRWHGTDSLLNTVLSASGQHLRA